MKHLILTAFLFAGTSAVAEDGLSWGGELDAKYKVDAEALTMTLEPDVTYTRGASALTVGMDIPVWNSTSTDSFVLLDSLDDGKQPDLDIEVTHQLRDNLELSLGTAWDLNRQAREEITLGVSFSF